MRGRRREAEARHGFAGRAERRGAWARGPIRAGDFTDRTFTTLEDRWRRLTAVVRRHVPADAPVSVLDLGCGTAEQLFDLAEALPAATLTGVDISAANIDRAERATRRRPDAARFTFITADYMNFHAGPFDVIWSDSVLHAIPVDTDALFAKLASELRPGGLLVYTMPSACLYNRALGLARRVLRATRSRATDALLLALARRAHPEHGDGFLAERIPYMYLVPARHDSPALHRRLESSLGLMAVETGPVAHASPAQMKHTLSVFRKT